MLRLVVGRAGEARMPCMDDDTFWGLLEKLDWGKTGDDEEVIEPAVMALAAMSVERIFQFEDALAQKLYLLDGERFAREIGESAYRGNDDRFSVDEFLYARCCVVANGRDFFNRVLADPSLMPKDTEFESLLSIAEKAHAEKTGDEEYPHSPSTSYETFSNSAGWKR
jgi:hypothetical protein